MATQTLTGEQLAAITREMVRIKSKHFGRGATERVRAIARRQREEARQQRQLAHQMSAWAGETLASARARHERPPTVRQGRDASVVPGAEPRT